jgi:endonuclease/exonuclease/phosphatase family metal-dependent hydrolase
LKEREKTPFIENLLGYLPGNTPLIIGGDFNFVENIQLDKIGGDKRKETSIIETFHEFKNIAGIRDAYRILYPRKVNTSHTNRGADKVKTRLDRFYVSNALTRDVTEVIKYDTTLSDHEAVVLYLKNHKSDIGKGYWKCNNSILTDPYLRDDIIHAIKKMGTKNGRIKLERLGSDKRRF